MKLIASGVQPLLREISLSSLALSPETIRRTTSYHLVIAGVKALIADLLHYAYPHFPKFLHYSFN